MGRKDPQRTNLWRNLANLLAMHGGIAEGPGPKSVVKSASPSGSECVRSAPRSAFLGVLGVSECLLTFSRAPGRKRDFPFFQWGGDPVQNRPRNPAPASCLFSTRKSRSEVPERGDFGEKFAWGRVGRTGQKKREKRMRKKRWAKARSRILLSTFRAL